VLRPLIVTGKPDIIDTAREIGVEEFSANIPEYCGVISVKPSAKVNRVKLEAEERGFDLSILNNAVQECVLQSIDQVMVDTSGKSAAVERCAQLPEGAIVIDIRHPNEQELRALVVKQHEVLPIPFYRLNAEFEKLDPGGRYYLYCEKGVMSELHASHLNDGGHSCVSVYRPSDEDTKESIE